MIAYKATYNMTCIDKTYEVGQTYTHEGELKLCSSGFHFCNIPDDTIEYYSYDKNYVLLEIEALGDIISSEDKSVTNKFKVLRVIPKEEYNSIFQRTKFDERGNIIYYKTSNGFEVWRKFDKNNNMIYYKDSDGTECWRKFDERNNCIHYKDSSGYKKFFSPEK